VTLRRAMFEGMGYDDDPALDRTCDAARAYFAEHMPTGAFRVWVAVSSGASTEGEAGSGAAGTCEEDLIASIGLVIHSTPPSPHNLAGRVGYIMNLVTLPAWRRRGIARALLAHVLDVLRAEGVPVASLHASDEGRSLYEDIGFRVRDAVPEMQLPLDRYSPANSIPSGK
jgi:ribosomal protein S18 acetylase RimI-like enzyme